MTTKRALISVYDKTNLSDFAKGLKRLGYEIVSTDGTATVIEEENIDVTEVSDLTGFPEMLNGRLKTLHPKVHGGILGIIDNAKHLREMAENDIEPFSLVVVNLYPFTADPSIELIDIGGPTMVRGAAKNHASVGVVTSPSQYAAVLQELETNGELFLTTRQELAKKAFRYTADYDKAVAEWMEAGMP